MAKNSDRGAKTSPSPLRLIPCRVEPGMFRDEFLVYLDLVDPQNPNQTMRVQLLVDQREVTNIRGTPKRGTQITVTIPIDGPAQTNQRNNENTHRRRSRSSAAWFEADIGR